MPSAACAAVPEWLHDAATVASAMTCFVPGMMQTKRWRVAIATARRAWLMGWVYRGWEARLCAPASRPSELVGCALLATERLRGSGSRVQTTSRSNATGECGGPYGPCEAPGRVRSTPAPLRGPERDTRAGERRDTQDGTFKACDERVLLGSYYY